MASPAIPFAPLTSHRAVPFVLGCPPPWPPRPPPAAPGRPPRPDAAAAARLLEEEARAGSSRARSPAGRPELESMVLDLNAESPTAGSASATSSSSGVFRFDLLGGTPDEEGCSPSPPVVTRQLFPLPSYPDAAAAPTAASNGSPPPPQAAGPWARRAADLVAPALGQGQGQGAVVMPAPSSPPAAVSPAAGKKSRRGPRSRSSQYRGVTFYRRTGRWESHIW